MLPNTSRAIDLIDDIDACKRVLAAYTPQEVTTLVQCKNMLRTINRMRTEHLERELRDRIASAK